MRTSFLSTFLLCLGDEIEFIVDSSLSCEESGRELIGDSQYVT